MMMKLKKNILLKKIINNNFLINHNMKINKIFKTNIYIMINFTFNQIDYNFFLNKTNLKNLNKCLRSKTIEGAIKNWKKLEKEYSLDLPRKEVSINYLKNKIKNYEIDYSFIGDYLINVNYNSETYIIDTINNTINHTDYVESYNNSSNLKIKKSTNKVSETEIETSQENETNDIMKKIEDINILNSEYIPEDIKKLVKFSMNNSKIVKPLIKVLNSKTNNIISEIINSSGLDIDLKEEVNSNVVIKEISKCLKILEELNNNDLSKIKVDEYDKFNFILSEIWNQIKKIILYINRLSENENYEQVLKKYKTKLDAYIYLNLSNYDNLEITLNGFLNYKINLLIESFKKVIESRILELNILLQSYDKENDNIILENKIKFIIISNNLFFDKFFANIYLENEKKNIFSNFNKIIGFDKILTNLDKDSKGFVIKKMNEDYNDNNTNIFPDYENKIFDNMINKTPLISEIYDESLKEYIYLDTKKLEIDLYNNYKSIIELNFDNYVSFSDFILKNHDNYMLDKKKKDISKLLLDLHEEVKFKLEIILKINN